MYGGGSEAVTFVLTGEPPPVHPARIGFTLRGQFTALSRITLDLSTRLADRSVAQIYARARRHDTVAEFVGTRPRKPMSQQHLTLAVFAAEVNDGRTWEAALGEWNRQHTDWRKTSVPAFTRAAREAYERVTGCPLSWKRGRGEREPKRLERPEEDLT